MPRTLRRPASEGLIELQRRGYEVRRVGGYAAIDQGRNQMATDALAAGFEETFWIDADIEFHPDAVERLRSYGLPITSGIYARKGARALGSQTLPGTARLGVGKGGGLCEILYAGAGFLHVRREVYRTIQERLALPTCNEQFRQADGPLLPADGACVGGRALVPGRGLRLLRAGAAVRIQDHGRHLDPPVAHRRVRLRLGRRRPGTPAARFVPIPDRGRESRIAAGTWSNLTHSRILGFCPKIV